LEPCKARMTILLPGVLAQTVAHLLLARSVEDEEHVAAFLHQPGEHDEAVRFQATHEAGVILETRLLVRRLRWIPEGRALNDGGEVTFHVSSTARVRISKLSRLGEPGTALGSTKLVCAVMRQSGSPVSKSLKASTSSGCMCG